MENDTSDLFNTEALSFDSTLDSLMDVDYNIDDPALPFDPPSDSPPSGTLMAAQNNSRVDIGHNDGETENLEVTKLEDEQNSEKGSEVNANIGDCKGAGKKDAVQFKDQIVHIDIEIKDRVANDTREPSPNFDQIKAKRQKNLAKQKPGVKRPAVSKSFPKTEKDKTDKQTKTRIDENLDRKEPPLKKLKISKEPNQNESEEKAVENTRHIEKDTAGSPVQGLGICTKNCGTDLVSISEKDADISKKEIQNSTVKTCETVSVMHKVKTESDRNRATDTASNEEKQKLKTNNIDIAEEEVESSNENTMQENFVKEELNLQNDDYTEGMISNKDEDGTIEDENEETKDFNDSNDAENLKESEMDDDDDVDNDDGNDGQDRADDEEYYDDEDDDEEVVDDDEIHNWLEEGLTKEEIRQKRKEELKEGEFTCREKFILEDKGSSPFEMLPVGWMTIAHNSGMPIYLHRESRVCTFARPYYIGSGSARKHDVPLSAIPCLQYRRAVEKEKTQQSETDENSMANGGSIQQNTTESLDKELMMPKPVVQCADNKNHVINIEPEELNKYCRGLFTFRSVTVKRFKTWREKRAHMVQERKAKESAVPRLAPDTKLITCPIPPDFSSSKKSKKKEFVLNPEGKTAVSILHEYTQNVLRVQPTYEFKEISNAELPFQATVMINGMQYGSGIASGKRQAKNEGAKATLVIFMPELADLWNDKSGLARQKDELKSDLKFFEDIAIEDPRVPELCVKSSLPQPYQVLHTCLQRNYGLGDTTFKVEKKMITNQKTEFTLSVGKRTCTVVCKNKRQAKQQAAQKMLQELHPFLKNWAAILRLYSRSTEVGYNERKEEFSAQEFHHEKKKNKEILSKLKDAMRKIQDQRKNFCAGTSASVSIPPPTTLDL